MDDSGEVECRIIVLEALEHQCMFFMKRFSRNGLVQLETLVLCRVAGRQTERLVKKWSSSPESENVFHALG